MHASAKARSMRAALLAAGAVAAGLIVSGCGKKDAEPNPSAAQPAAETGSSPAAPPSAPTPETVLERVDHAAAAAVPADEPTKLTVKWDDKMPYAPENPCMVGSRLVPHLYGKLQFLAGAEPVKGHGTLTVELYQPARDGEGPDIRLQGFLIEPASLDLYKDENGPGYTLALPWGDYKAELRQVKMRLTFESVR